MVEHLLMFMDPASILNLAHSHSLVEQVLRSASVWTELIKRVCSFGREEQDFPPTNLIIQRKCEQVRAGGPSTIWEFSTDETTDVAADGTFWSVRLEKGGEEWTYHDWERLEEIMGMTEEEWFEEVEGLEEVE